MMANDSASMPPTPEGLGSWEDELEERLNGPPCGGIGSAGPFDPDEDLSHLRLNLDLRAADKNAKVVLPNKEGLQVLYRDTGSADMVAYGSPDPVASILSSAGFSNVVIRKTRRRKRQHRPTSQTMKLGELVARAPWREAITYRDTWPHEYVLSEKDGQRELLNAIYARFQDGEGVDCRFFNATNKYLFIGNFKYWFNNQWDGFDPDGENVINRARLYRDRRDFLIQPGDTGKPEDYPADPAREVSDTDC